MCWAFLLPCHEKEFSQVSKLQLKQDQYYLRLPTLFVALSHLQEQDEVCEFRI